jgi:peptidoglycan hydrolase-like protein with peptidoglycan-binding domain
MIACACTVASPMAAENRALIVGTQTYGDATELNAAAEISDAAEALEAAGFDVVSRVDADIDGLRGDLDALLTEDAPERSVILLTGLFANSGSLGWYLPGEVDEPSLATADSQALSLGTVMEVARRSQDGAVVLLGVGTAEADAEDTEAGDTPVALGTGLLPGLGDLVPPEGVTVITGAIPDILTFAEETLITRGVSLPEMLEGVSGLDAQGMLSPAMSFLPTEDVAPEEEAAAAERADWQSAQDRDDIAAYETYLTRYPDGTYADEARAAINDPERIETALELDRSERRQIQGHLNVLGYNTRGVDGIFGPGSRSAINSWQQANGFETTGFLNTEQIGTLSEMAATREAELEEERREQEAERERADRAYWEDIGRGQDEAGLRAYLERFPDGLFSDVASARLSEIDTDRDRAAWESAEAEDTEAAYRGYLDAHGDGAFADRARARIADMNEADAIAADEAAWSTAQEEDTADAYADYLDRFPDGAYLEPASDRLAELTEDSAADETAALQEQAQEEEARLGLNTIARSLVEMQLVAQGFNPGQTDGQLDDNTREALRSYQNARGLPVTGYVGRQTLNRLITDGLPLSP